MDPLPRRAAARPRRRLGAGRGHVGRTGATRRRWCRRLRLAAPPPVPARSRMPIAIAAAARRPQGASGAPRPDRSRPAPAPRPAGAAAPPTAARRRRRRERRGRRRSGRRPAVGSGRGRQCPRWAARPRPALGRPGVGPAPPSRSRRPADPSARRTTTPPVTTDARRGRALGRVAPAGAVDLLELGRRPRRAPRPGGRDPRPRREVAVSISRPAATFALDGGGAPSLAGGPLSLAQAAVRRVAVELSVDEAHDRVELWLWRGSALEAAEPGGAITIGLGDGDDAEDVLTADVAGVEATGWGSVLTAFAPSRRLSDVHVGQSYVSQTLADVVSSLLDEGGVDAGVDRRAAVAPGRARSTPVDRCGATCTRSPVAPATRSRRTPTGRCPSDRPRPKPGFGLGAVTSALGLGGGELREGAELMRFRAGPRPEVDGPGVGHAGRLEAVVPAAGRARERQRPAGPRAPAAAHPRAGRRRDDVGRRCRHPPHRPGPPAGARPPRPARRRPGRRPRLEPTGSCAPATCSTPPPASSPTSPRGVSTIMAFPGHAGRLRPLARWRSLARIVEDLS